MSLVGCKKSQVDPIDPKNDEIRIGSPSLLVSKADPTTLLHSEFVTGDMIGVYSVENAGEDLSLAKQSNVGYKYDKDNTLWVVKDGVEPLKWQFTVATPNVIEVPVDLVGYFPYNDGVTLDADNVSMPFTLQIDQSTTEAVIKNDLLWARSTGKKADQSYEELTPEWTVINGQGIKKSTDVGKKINLNFNHIMAAVDFKVALKQVPSGAETFTDVKITKIEILGPDITVAGKLNLSKGTFTETANATDVNGDIKWNPAEGMLLNIHAVDVEDNDLVYSNVCCMVAQPKDFIGKAGNMIKYTFSYTYDPDGDGVTPSEVIVKDYFYSLGKGGTNDVNALLSNTYNKVKAMIVISSNEIRITTSINPWAVVEYPPINPE